MTAPAKITQADMERAIRAARKQGCDAVEVTGGSIRIIVNTGHSVEQSPQATGENTCDGLFGVSD